ncbi:MAG: response regulator transcription factor [Burkholderiales bacterium]|jgi:DNA-binding NarL/FixJ family response regulator|nr:response regulator transcription factor [Burkholderiales bacterium]
MNIRVLIADDHAVMREGLRTLIENGAAATVVAAVVNGREAIEAAVLHHPDVVVMDISMPDMNGIEATRLIRQRCPATQVVILSMHTSPERIHQAFAAGATAYVLKEAAGTEVLAAVRAAAGGRRYVSSAIDKNNPGNTAATAGPLASLSSRERQVLQLVVEGKSSAEIAVVVDLSPKTVETYRSRLMKKLGVADMPALVKFAIQHGITSLD